MKTLATAFALVGACALAAIVHEPASPESDASRAAPAASGVALGGSAAACGDPLGDCGVDADRERSAD